MGYCAARLERENLHKSYRVYVTDALKVIGENTARFAGGSTMRMRWLDAIEPAPEPIVDDRPAVEIAEDIWARAKIGKGGE